MLRICRAEDGQVFQVSSTLRDIERAGSLESFLHRETGVDTESILAYLSDGRRLTNANLRELAGMQDQTIVVFNKAYLTYDLDDVLYDLRVEPQPLPPIEETISATPPYRPSQLSASYLRTAHVHYENVQNTMRSLSIQLESINTACNSLDFNVLSIIDIFESVATSAHRELEKQAVLLAGIDADLAIISRVEIHVDFVSAAVRRAMEAGEPPRTLGDYVSNVKMKQVAETCSRTHEELKSRFNQTEENVVRLKQGADEIRSLISDISLLEKARSCQYESELAFEKITSISGQLDGPNNTADSLLQELKNLDVLLRNNLTVMADTKNAYTSHIIGVLRRISVLNNDMVQLSPALANLQASFRGKNSFLHIQRLHNMLYAYGATVIEVVRRKEFARFFYQRAQSILEVMAKLSISERKRRQIYRSELHGQLPFDTRNMDEAVPAIDFSPSGSTDAVYSLERVDVDSLLRLFDDLEQSARSEGDNVALNALTECRAALLQLVAKMDGIEAGFDRIAERSLLSASRLTTSRRRLSAADEQAYQQLADQLQSTEQAKVQQELQFRSERALLQGEVHRLKSELGSTNESLQTERDRADRLERELHQVNAQLETGATARRLMQDRLSECLSDAEHRRKSLEDALAEGTEQSKVADHLRQELTQVQSEFTEVKALEARNSENLAALLNEQMVNLRKLEEARGRGEDLQSQIQSVRAENAEVNRALGDATREKDRLLRVQASEHDRIIRDYVAEADGDRAVLEHQFSELKGVLDGVQEQLKDARMEAEVANSDAAGLREELQQVEHELREARHVERVLREDLNTGRASQSNFEHRLEVSDRLVASILDVAISFRNSHVRALQSVHTMTSHPGTSRQATMSDSIFSTGLRHSIVGQFEEPAPIDPSDPCAALDALRSFDHDHFQEALGKPALTIRKWQKQCKEYRERAKGKISFRNFTKGDLALFLPTRNSVSKPWAAFNVSFPHYFLQAMGHLAEQLKTREWIVARITSITERVVDQKDPDSNPYGLGDGVKYYMLEVEDWTQPTSQKRRTLSRAIPNAKDAMDGSVTLVASPPDIPPVVPESEVEEAFTVTRPPTSHLFPVRTRANSSPNAGPSSLSRLLAQANPDNPLVEPTSPSKESVDTVSPSPTTSPPPPPSPSHHSGSATASQRPPILASPLRPGSRASRLSTSSRFSTGLLPPLGSTSTTGTPGIVKAAATTAISAHPLSTSSSSSPSSGGGLIDAPTPSPQGSLSEGMSNIWSANSRRRTTSYHTPRTSPLAPASEASTSTVIPAHSRTVSAAERPALTATTTLANLANSWGMSFGRKITKKASALAPTAESPADATAIDSPATATGSADRGGKDASARELLKRF